MSLMMSILKMKIQQQRLNRLKVQVILIPRLLQLVCLWLTLTTPLNIADSEAEDAVVDEVPMPTEWLVFVRFGPPANGDCDHIWLLEAADDSKSNKKFSRKKQREEKLERDEKERAATRSAEPSNKKPKTEDAEVAALEKFNNLLEADQIGIHYREAC